MPHANMKFNSQMDAMIMRLRQAHVAHVNQDIVKIFYCLKKIYYYKNYNFKFK